MLDDLDKFLFFEELVIGEIFPSFVHVVVDFADFNLDVLLYGFDGLLPLLVPEIYEILQIQFFQLGCHLVQGLRYGHVLGME